MNHSEADQYDFKEMELLASTPFLNLDAATQTQPTGYATHASGLHQNQGIFGNTPLMTHPPWPDQYAQIQQQPTISNQFYQFDPLSIPSIPSIPSQGYTATAGIDFPMQTWRPTHTEQEPLQPFPLRTPVEPDSINYTDDSQPVQSDSGRPLALIIDGALSPSFRQFLEKAPPYKAGEPDVHSQLPRHGFDI